MVKGSYWKSNSPNFNTAYIMNPNQFIILVIYQYYTSDCLDLCCCHCTSTVLGTSGGRGHHSKGQSWRHDSDHYYSRNTNTHWAHLFVWRPADGTVCKQQLLVRFLWEFIEQSSLTYVSSLPSNYTALTSVSMCLYKS
jgi:hypothetical protein